MTTVSKIALGLSIIMVGGFFALVIAAYAAGYGPGGENENVNNPKMEKFWKEREAKKQKTAKAVKIKTVDPDPFMRSHQVMQQPGESNKDFTKRWGMAYVEPWAGRHSLAEVYLKEQLLDPGSFEEIATYIGGDDSGKTYRVKIEYRAKNTFGGYATGSATVRFDLDENFLGFVE